MFVILRKIYEFKGIIILKIDSILEKLDMILAKQQVLQSELEALKLIVYKDQSNVLSESSLEANPEINSETSTDEDYHHYFANDFSKYVPSFVGSKVLIVGCGKGEDCRRFIEFGADLVHGLDISENIGKDFKHEKVEYIRCNAEQMQINDATYDYVYSVAALEHIHQIDKAFKEIVRVTRPGGIIYCVAACPWMSREGHHMFGVFDDYPWIHLRLSKEEILNYCLTKNLESTDSWNHIKLLLMELYSKADIQVEEVVNFMFSDYFNFWPVQKYVDICSALPVSEVIRNSVYHESEDCLTPEIYLELDKLGYSKYELLALTHTFVAVK